MEQFAKQIYQDIARQFPICCASDEFYFFPQVLADDSVRWEWDDFSPAGIELFAAKSRRWEAELKGLRRPPSFHSDIDAEFLLTMLRTLREQLQDVAPQVHQPTFHLSVVVAGLSEALESGNSLAWRSRIAGLPDFLRQAACILNQLPEAFLRIGGQMLADTLLWLDGLRRAGIDVSEGTQALREFSEHLDNCPVREGFLLPPELFERLVMDHLGCRCNLDELERELQLEYSEMDELLKAEAGILIPGQDWQEAEPSIPFQVAPDNDLKQLYRPELLRLEQHARMVGLVPDLAGELQPELAEVPSNLTAIRASDSYSARVGHPARGGVFYYYEKGTGDDGGIGRTLEYRMTAAHETWPGHHLLDVCRWNLPRPLRRPLERPLFYEGWACFAETLLALTGYFDGTWDRFLLARRRIERAARGLVDIGLQSGKLKMDEAVELLVKTGYSRQKAVSVVPKYILRPGYQVCYTIGLRRMLSLHDQFAAMGSGAFARRVLTQGEVDFTALTAALQHEGD